MLEKCLYFHMQQSLSQLTFYLSRDMRLKLGSLKYTKLCAFYGMVPQVSIEPFSYVFIAFHMTFMHNNHNKS